MEQVLCTLLGWEVRWAEHPDELRPSEGPALAYGHSAPPGAFHVRPHAVMQRPWRDAGGMQVHAVEDGPVICAVEGGQLPFDAFAASFWMLSRWEEWLGLPADEHGRPITSTMLAARHGFLQRPVVDEWSLMLARRWRDADPRVPLPQRRYRQVVTIDLDNGFKYLGREWWRTMGGWARDAANGRWHEAAERRSVLGGRQRDPFMLDDEVLSAFEAHADRRIAFILAADRGPHDHAVPVSDQRYRAYLCGLRSRMEVGLHPSYRTSEVEGLARRERDRLISAIDQPVTVSRQHFLRAALPGTFREAIRLGIREEHSMGCHDRLGFRAGTCTPFNWYDLEREESTPLIIHPFAVMDNTLRDKLRLTPEAAVMQASQVIESIRRVNGTFTGLWHESFLAATGPSTHWRAAILRIIETAAP